MRYPWGALRRLALVTVLSLALPPAAAGQDDDDKSWTAYLVEVSFVQRQDPPPQMLQREAELRETLERTSDEAERGDLEAKLETLKERIELERGSIVAGWGEKVDRRGQRADRRTSMVGFLFDGGERTARVLGDIEPGTFIEVARGGLRDLFTTGGRFYRLGRNLRGAERPDWWSAPAAAAVPSEPTPDTVGLVEVTPRFTTVKPRDYGELHRFDLEIKIAQPPAEGDTAHIDLAVRVPLRGGGTLGPLHVPVSIERGQSGIFWIHRSWEIGPREGVTVERGEIDVRVMSVRFE